MTVLDDILVGVRADLAERQEPRPPRRPQGAAPPAATPPLDGAARCCAATASRSSPRSSGPARARVRSRRSPTRPRSRPTTRPAAPPCISVLTEGRRFGGSLDDLVAVRAAVDDPGAAQGLHRQQLPAVGGARCGADLVLLIVAALEQPALVSLVERAESLGHDARWSRCTTRRRSTRAVDAGAASSGSTPATSRPSRSTATTFARLRAAHPRRRRHGRRVRRPRPARRASTYARAGADAVLVGETLVHRQGPARRRRRPRRRRQPPGAEARKRRAMSTSPRSRPTPRRRRPPGRGRALRPVRRPVRARGAGRGPRPARRAAYDAAKADPAFAAELDRLQRTYTGRPSPLTEAHRFVPSTPAAPGSCSSARTSTTPASHKINNVLGQALLTQRMGKTAGHRRDRGRPARRRHRDRLRAARARLRRLHGRGGHPAAGAQRRADAAARRRGRPGHQRAAAPSRTPSTRRCATGSPTSTPPTTCSARSPARTRSP